MSLLVIDPSKHFPRDTEAARFFRRELYCPEIMTFWNNERSMWVLGHWLDSTHHYVEEIEDLGPNFELLTPEFAAMIRNGWGHQTDWDKVRKRVLSSQRARLRSQEDDIYEADELHTWAVKKTDHPIPYSFSMGRTRMGKAITTVDP